jgi:NAD(P)-dependent dehydrogenase (short-subunit alcohol dehydrogenase family)
MSRSDNFAGKLALVTGAGDGIGAMLARGFASWGMRVCVQDIRADAAEAVAAEIGGGAFSLVFDVSDRAACMAAAETLAEKGEPLSILWANAGAGVGSSLIKGKADTLEWAFDVNVLGIAWTVQAFVPLMTGEQRHVGFTASTAALRPVPPEMGLYPVSKHAAFAVAEGLSGELASKCIASTILFPGLLNTNIWDGARARPERFGGERRADPAISTRWREAKDPVLMWPHIEQTVLSGGGYLTCSTEPGQAEIMTEWHDRLKASIVEI